MTEVAAWLRELGLEQYTALFEANDVDAQTLRSLTEADIVEIGVRSVGHRRKLIAAIAELAASPPLSIPEAASTVQRHAEYRQLTVLYCEMTGSAAQSLNANGAEALREAIQSFHRTCTRIVADYDGHVANFYGDCVLSYFGWPRAHEDDAERAVRVGLSLVQLVNGLNAPGGSLFARVGIATGPVVVGDLIHAGPAREQSAVGVTPNLGARMLGLAQPGQVVIDELTRRLLAPSFVVQPLGSHALKGIAQPVAAHAVSGERLADSRFDAHKGQEVAPMIGRDQELALLMERWERARGGEGQAMLLVGEAGIGKSRLVRAVLDACAAPSHRRIRWQCSPYHAGSALWPVIQRLGRSVGLHVDDATDAALDKLETVTGHNNEASALYATLLGLNGSQRYGPLEMTPQMLRERTLELMAEQLLEMAEQGPLLLVVEDAHWLDPTTLELIERCLSRIDSAHMLILITSRPDKQPELGAHPSVSRLSLNRLNRASVETMVAQLGGDSLQTHTMATIVAQTDGVPLFVEELTKAVLETGEAAIPASLHGSLMARLDHVPEVKEVAQIAACIGREFDQALLQAVAERPDGVAAAMGKLVVAELVFRRGDRANPRYIFKHALVQEAAYASLLRTTRQAIHARILQVLENAQVRAPCEILARHAEGARQFDRAIAYWSEAGDAATAKSAYAEAAGFLDAAIALMQAQNDGVDRRAQEVELQLRLGQVRVATEGYGSPATLAAFERARDLLTAVPQSAVHEMRVQYGLWVCHHTRGNLKEHTLAAERLFATGQACGDTASRGMGHRILAGSLLYAGDFARARHHLEEALALLDPSHNEPVVVTQFGVNPEAAILFYLGWTLCILGFGARSRDMLSRSRRIATTLPQVNARALIYMNCGLAGVCAGDVDSVRGDSESLAELGARHRLPMYRGYADVFAGWIALESGQPPHDAVDLLERGLKTLAQIGSRNYDVLFIAHLARALAASGRHDRAASTMAHALAESQSRGIGWCDAELWRLHGELLLHGPRPAHHQAAGSFEKAVELATMRGAKLWERRATLSLARVRAASVGIRTNPEC